MINRLCLLLAVGAVASTADGTQLTIDFEELPFGNADYYNGADLAGGFTSHGATFPNQFTDYGGGCCWNGWAYSRTTDQQTPGPDNQYSAWPGHGAGGSGVYGVAYSGHDAGGGLIPQISLPAGAEPVQISVANTTYAALSMRYGDSFTERFGGATGNDPDWLLLTIEGLDSSGTSVAETSIYLADYRAADPADDTILADWAVIDLTPMEGLGVETLAFGLTSTDNNSFGMNTPAYFAADDLVLDLPSVPGDIDQDGKVDTTDLAVWQQTFGVSTGADLIAWQRAWKPTPATLAGVPEPPTIAVMTGGLDLAAVGAIHIIPEPSAGVLLAWFLFCHRLLARTESTIMLSSKS